MQHALTKAEVVVHAKASKSMFSRLQLGYLQVLHQLGYLTMLHHCIVNGGSKVSHSRLVIELKDNLEPGPRIPSSMKMDKTAVRQFSEAWPRRYDMLLRAWGGYCNMPSRSLHRERCKKSRTMTSAIKG